MSTVELSEQETAALNEGIALRVETEMLLPLLQTKMTLAQGKLIQHYKAGDRDAVFASAAELSALSDIRSTISQKVKLAEALERKIYE